MIEHRQMQAEYCLCFDVRLLFALSRIHILQVLVWGGFVSGSYPSCGGKYMLYLGISGFMWKSELSGLLLMKKCLWGNKKWENWIVCWTLSPSVSVLSFLSVLYRYLSHLLSNKNLKHQAALSWKALWSQICNWYPEIQSQLCCWLQAKLDFIF